MLLAEDNPVNQKVAARLLEKLGCRVDVVADGRAAVDAWRNGRYDLIFMDCQMPELDGYQATAEIRRLERGARTPIVALTAHAMQGAERTCREAGMDDFLTKPINRKILEACVDRHLGASAAAGTAASDAAPGTQAPTGGSSATLPVDWPALLALAGDEESARELASLYLENGRRRLLDIDEALARGNLAVLGDRAHEIRGASASMCACGASAAAAQLEAAARAGEGGLCPPLAAGLRREFGSAERFLLGKVA